MWWASLQQRGGSLKHLSSHPLRQKRQGSPDLGSQVLSWSHKREFGYPARAKAEVDIASAER